MVSKERKRRLTENKMYGKTARDVNTDTCVSLQGRKLKVTQEMLEKMVELWNRGVRDAEIQKLIAVYTAKWNEEVKQ